MNGFVASVAAIAYVLGLFAIAAWAERGLRFGGAARLKLPAYGLALAVYCTSWTFFGTVGTAAVDGWRFLPIYLGPILLFVIAPTFLSSLIVAVREEGASSISDFIGARFGKSRGVAALVTLLALFGTVPYLALQLRSVGRSFAMIAGGEAIIPMAVSAAVLGLFALLFGTRRYVASARSQGVHYAVAVESLVKLVALLLVAGFSIYAFLTAPEALKAQGLATFKNDFAPQQINFEFVLVTILSLAAFITLPRQFYVGVIAASAPKDPESASKAFISYLLLTTAAVIPIVLAGFTLLPKGAAPDLFVLALPMTMGVDMLTFFVFIGGFSAAAGMVIVESIALSTMVSNDLVVPFLLRGRQFANDANFGKLMLLVRRIAIVVIMVAALAYATLVPPNQRLASMGMVAFAAMAQFAPVLIMAVYRSNNDALAAQAGLLIGLLLWLYTLFLPTIADPDWLMSMAGGWLNPTGLFGFMGASMITHGVLVSLGGNIICLLLVSARKVKGKAISLPFRLGTQVGTVTNLGQLNDMVAWFAGPELAEQAFDTSHARNAPISREAARKAERIIAGVVGAPSAHAIISSALTGSALKVADVARLLDQTGQSLQFSRGLLAATLEHIDPGVSVIDKDLRLIAWNSRYLELFDYPTDMVRVGTPVGALIRFNALRGECGPGEVDDHVAKRLEHMRRGQRHSFERRRPDGRVIKTIGGPMPDGGYVMCFSDITAEAQARAGLEMARAELEHRVEARTQELKRANEALARATLEKTRFLAAASHDLLQPLHAARLFASALAQDVSESGRPLLANVDRSIDAADALLRALLDISKLDAGGIRPQVTRFSLSALIEELCETFEPLVAEKALQLHRHIGDFWVETDHTLLRSILQNFMSNAVRYTKSGGVLVATRRRDKEVRVEIYDTGCGIAPEHQSAIFREFERLGTSGEAGIGLGLAIVERSARLIGAYIDLRSNLGRGSRFSITLPIAESKAPTALSAVEKPCYRDLSGTRVLIIDDDSSVREATAALMQLWACDPLLAKTAKGAMDKAEATDFALVDYDLGHESEDGIALIARLRRKNPQILAALITAERSEDIVLRCEGANIRLFSKPLDAKKLRDWMTQTHSASR